MHQFSSLGLGCQFCAKIFFKFHSIQLQIGKLEVHFYRACSLEIISQISQPFSSIFLTKNQLDQPDFSPGEQAVCT
jgi:hypothetical protein